MKNRKIFLLVNVAMFFLTAAVSFAEQEAGLSPTSKEAAVLESQKTVSPLELRIDDGNKEFKVGDKVVFELVLVNVSRKALKVFRIEEKTTFCSFNDSNWGTTSPAGDPVVIMLPGESIRKKFKLGGLDVPGELKVNCSYGMGEGGVRPAASKTFNIVR